MVDLTSLSDAELSAHFRSLSGRSAEAERYLDIVLPDEDAGAVALACQASDAGFGDFYAWQLWNTKVAEVLRKEGMRGLFGIVATNDHSDYGALDEALASGGPLVAAIPHHGHYVLAIMALIERVRARRDVMIFYADPRKRAGNAIFDDGFATCHWADLNSRVQLLHDNRDGLAKALRGLREGKVLVILPDVGPDPERTRLVPFLSRALPTMLGTATLSRKTGARILPVVETLGGDGLHFCATFSKELSTASSNDANESLYNDYGATCSLFSRLGELMQQSLHRWQFCREFFLSEVQLPRLEPEAVGPIASALLASSRANPFAIPPVHVP
jgi:hypothetical protein